MTTTDQGQRDFTRTENIHLDRFLTTADDFFNPNNPVVRWNRVYKCECGFACTAPGEIWAHTRDHKG